jgi:hypothetical protein
MTISTIDYDVSASTVRVTLSTGAARVVQGADEGREFASIDAACAALGDDPREVAPLRFRVAGKDTANTGDECEVIAHELRRLGVDAIADGGRIVTGDGTRYYPATHGASAFNVEPLMRRVNASAPLHLVESRGVAVALVTLADAARRALHGARVLRSAVTGAARGDEHARGDGLIETPYRVGGDGSVAHESAWD